jgi:phage/plasmid-like protein (TIGR03299 family)
MAHEINHMMYVGDMPWHGLGVRLPQNASYDEIVEAAGFFTVLERPVYVPGQLDPVPGVKALIRADTSASLAVVGTRYEIVQASDVARTLVEAAGGTGAIFHTAGTLGPTASRFWLLAELPEPMRVKGDSSVVRKYLLGTSAHDGASPITLMNCGVRVVCSNTLGTALGEKTKARWTIRHTRSAPERLREAAQGFREIVQGYQRFEQLANVLASTRMSDSQLLKAVSQVMPVPQDDKDHKRIEVGRAKVIELFEAGRGMNGIRGTAWAGWQAFTEYADHHRPVRGGTGENRAAQRLESVWFGGAADLKKRALFAVADEARIPLLAA